MTMTTRSPRFRPALALAGAATACLLASTASAQNLSERINHVMQQRAQAEAHNTSKAELLGTLLYTDLSVQFQETPAREAINYLQTVLGINLIGRYSDDRTGVGIDPETPITLNVTNQPALNVLEMLLDQCSTDSFDQCTWQLRNGFVEVGTKERLNAAREVRYYPIRDLLFQPPRFNNAPELDLDAALNQGGNLGGGGGGGAGGGGFGGGGLGGGGGGGLGGGGGGGAGGGGFGGGGLGGGGGGGLGGGSGGGGGGSIFGDPGEEEPRVPESELAQELIDIIQETVETDAWLDAASIRYYQGTLIIRAPDYIQRQIGGYPFAIRPPRTVSSAAPAGRYVTFTGAMSNVANAGFRETDPNEFGGAAAGRP